MTAGRAALDQPSLKKQTSREAARERSKGFPNGIKFAKGSHLHPFLKERRCIQTSSGSIEENNDPCDGASVLFSFLQGIDGKSQIGSGFSRDIRDFCSCSATLNSASFYFRGYPRRLATPRLSRP